MEEVRGIEQKNATIDWTKREKVRTRLKAMVKSTLKRFGYPPNLEKLATENVLEQAEKLADELAVV